MTAWFFTAKVNVFMNGSSLKRIARASKMYSSTESVRHFLIFSSRSVCLAGAVSLYISISMFSKIAFASSVFSLTNWRMSGPLSNAAAAYCMNRSGYKTSHVSV